MFRPLALSLSRHGGARRARGQMLRPLVLSPSKHEGARSARGPPVCAVQTFLDTENGAFL
jgi:hypothetical protein